MHNQHQIITIAWKDYQILNPPVPGLWFGLCSLCRLFMIFLESLEPRRRLVVCKNVKSEHYSPKNNFQMRICISVHCALSEVIPTIDSTSKYSSKICLIWNIVCSFTTYINWMKNSEGIKNVKECWYLQVDTSISISNFALRQKES